MTSLGHRRPLGTTTRVRMDWNSDVYAEPRLGDITLEEGTERAYVVVGVEEHRDSPAVWKLVLERIMVEELENERLSGTRYWPHVRYRRRS